VKLLIDEMFATAIAEQLRARGRDVVSVHETPDLEGASDEELLRVAVAADRAIVTENVQDFRPLQAAAPASRRPCPALIFTTNRQYPRANTRTSGRLVAALDRLLEAKAVPSGAIFLTPMSGSDHL
jgi:predicted nuclease of predicted toxin-antitoxin system